MENVQLIVIDINFIKIRVIMDFFSLQWIQKYYDIGVFEIHCHSKYAMDLKKARYIYRKGIKNLGVINYFKLDNLKNDCMVKGSFVECVLFERVINETITLTGTHENVARKLVEKFCISDSSRAIPHLKLGQINYLGSNVSLQRTGKSVYEAIKEILEEQELWYKIDYDFNDDSLSFYVFQGLDRSTDQNINPWCIFSSEFYNLIEDVYTAQDDKKNYVYVAGQGSGEDRVTIEFGILDYETDRRELYVDARDLQQGDTMTDSEYKQLLIDRGLIKLAQFNFNEGIEIKDYQVNSMDYEIGDLVTYVNSTLGIKATGRVSEIWEIFELDRQEKFIKIGDKDLTITQIIKRLVIN